MTTIDEILIGMQSSNEETRLEATRACRKLASEKNPPIDEIIEKGVVPLCIEFLKAEHNVPLQFEACWVLTNVASGTLEQTQAVINDGAIPELVKLLNSLDVDLVTQTVWTLANIVGDGPEARDLVIAQGALPIVINLVKPETPLALVREIAWMIANLCKSKEPALPFVCVEAILPLLANFLGHPDREVLADACRAFSYLIEADDENIQRVVDIGVVPRLVELLGSQESSVLIPALQTVGNIVSGNDVQTDTVVTQGALKYLRALLTHERSKIVKDAAWMISNIAAGNCDQKQKVIEANVIPPLFQVMRTGNIFSQEEATWAIANLISGANIQQIVSVVQSGVLKAFSDLLKSISRECRSTVRSNIQSALNAFKKSPDSDQVKPIVEEASREFCKFIDWECESTMFKIFNNIKRTLDKLKKLCETDQVTPIDKEGALNQGQRNIDDSSYLDYLRSALAGADAKELQTVLEGTDVIEISEISSTFEKININ